MQRSRQEPCVATNLLVVLTKEKISSEETMQAVDKTPLSC